MARKATRRLTRGRALGAFVDTDSCDRTSDSIAVEPAARPTTLPSERMSVADGVAVKLR
jgi:hypothetical protein